MAKRHKIGNIRGSSVANQSASRVVHPGFSVWRSLDVLDGTFSFYNGSGSTISGNTVTGANGTSFELDHTKDTTATGYWTANSNAAGRYYKKLIGPRGQLKWSDQFTFELCIEKTSADSELADGIAVGIAESGVASSAGSARGESAWEHYGAKLYNRVAGGSPDGSLAYIQSGQDQNTAGNSAGKKLYCSWGPPVDGSDEDGNPTTRRGYLYLLNANDKLISATTISDYSVEFDGSGDVYLYVAPNFYSGSSSSSNLTATWKIWYRVGLQNGGFSPDWIPGGGDDSFGGLDLP